MIITKMRPLHWILTQFNPYFQALFPQNHFYITLSPFYTVVENEREFHITFMYIPVIEWPQKRWILFQNHILFSLSGGRGCRKKRVNTYVSECCAESSYKDSDVASCFNLNLSYIVMLRICVLLLGKAFLCLLFILIRLPSVNKTFHCHNSTTACFNSDTW
jgi:hypothetical protein